jgi:hypothetical protein
MEKVCLYSELDPISGSIGYGREFLPSLVDDLILACLIYDKVIIQTPAILEHPLTLPAFEILEPFVKSGILWTSGGIANDLKEESPLFFLKNRMERTFQQDYKGSNYSKTLERWGELLPKNFLIKRDPTNQLICVTSGILNNIEKHKWNKIDEYYAKKIQDTVEYMRDDKAFSKEITLALVASFKDYTTFSFFKDMNIIIQAEYLRQGTHSKSTHIVVKPTNQTKIFNSFFENSLYIPVCTSYKKAEEFLMRNSWFSKFLKSYPINDLYTISISKEWKVFRNEFIKDEGDSIFYEKLGEYKNKKFESSKVIERMSNILLTSVIHQKWNLINISIIPPYRENETKSTFLDMNKSTIYNNKITIHLTKKQLLLLSMIISIGADGISFSEVKQFDVEFEFEFELLQHKNFMWKKQLDEHSIFNESRENRLLVFKNRLNKRLKSIKIHILTKDGRWFLNSYDVNILGTIWSMYNQKIIFNKPKLTRQSSDIWNILSENFPSVVHNKMIAKAIFGNENEVKRVSDAIYRLNKQLTSTAYSVKRDFNGYYFLKHEIQF